MENKLHGWAAVVYVLRFYSRISFEMTIYLARDFSKSTGNSAAQLQEIKSLFNRMIQDQEEKKKILKIRNWTWNNRLKWEQAELEQKTVTSSTICIMRRIQAAILPETNSDLSYSERRIHLYLPKDIVSGDFYTFSQRDGKAIFAAADCTGHGVTGAFMSMIGSSLLNQIVNERGITQPARILNHLNAGIIEALKQKSFWSKWRNGHCYLHYRFVRKYSALRRSESPLWLIRMENGAKSKRIKWLSADFVFRMIHLSVIMKWSCTKWYCVIFFRMDIRINLEAKKEKKMLSKRFRDKLLSIQHLLCVIGKRTVELF